MVKKKTKEKIPFVPTCPKCSFCTLNAQYLVGQSTNVGKTIKWKLACSLHHDGWWEGGDWIGNTYALQLQPSEQLRTKPPSKGPKVMQDYLVSWKINVSAKSPEEAAQLVLEIQRDAASIATVFDVRDAEGTLYHVDLSGMSLSKAPAAKSEMLQFISVCDARYTWLDDPKREEKWEVVVNLVLPDGGDVTLKVFPPHRREDARDYACAVDKAIRAWLEKRGVQ